MTSRRPADCTDMGQVRTEIDRIDDAMVALIADRFGYVDRAWQLKRAAGTEGAVVPWRIQQVIDRVRAQAAARGLPPEMVEMVSSQWRNMIGWFVQYEEEKLRASLEDGLDSGEAENLPGPATARGNPKPGA
jgi:isochorismate pyruvate lyase